MSPPPLWVISLLELKIEVWESCYMISCFISLIGRTRGGIHFKEPTGVRVWQGSRVLIASSVCNVQASLLLHSPQPGPAADISCMEYLLEIFLAIQFGVTDFFNFASSNDRQVWQEKMLLMKKCEELACDHLSEGRERWLVAIESENI